MPADRIDGNRCFSFSSAKTNASHISATSVNMSRAAELQTDTYVAHTYNVLQKYWYCLEVIAQDSTCIDIVWFAAAAQTSRRRSNYHQTKTLF